MFDKLQKKEAKLAVIGLGYVGLPIAIEFAKKFTVVGFDIKEEVVKKLKNRIDPAGEVAPEEFEGTDILFTTNIDDLKSASFYIVAVPTPIDEHKKPDLFPLIKSCETVGKVISKGDYVVFESTVYPGCTEEDCVPVIEDFSKLEFVKDFKVGYSPERINPGDKVNTLTTITKITSGCDVESSEQVAKVYESIIKAGIFKASSIKVAEAAKIIENTQRDVNIALMNELSIIFNRIGINTFEVLEAAGTKWNFLKFFPGLVGGHCIGVDPYYLVHKARELDYHTHIISAGRFVNDSMGGYVAKQTVKKIVAQEKNVLHSKVLIMGVTFKENVSDIRNTKVEDLVKELESYKVNVDVVDPYANPEELKAEYGIELKEKIGSGYDAVIVAVSHKEYVDLDEKYFIDIMSENGILIDVKGMYRERIKNLLYWSL
ncbi:MAG: nucleotide sugar dehydrogenase [Bacteroidales bacterium]|nr:nucleotide sugar dehydrogenase [Bacteroidales bacterium]